MQNFLLTPEIPIEFHSSSLVYQHLRPYTQN